MTRNGHGTQAGTGLELKDFGHERGRFAVAACITAFDAAGNFDPDGQRVHLQRLAAAGVIPLMASSGGGEGHTLSPNELAAQLSIAREEAAGKVRVDFMSVEGRSAAQTIERCNIAVEHGADLIHLYNLEVGHGKRPTEPELERYLRDVLENVNTRFYLCNQPTMVGYEVPTSMVRALVREYPQVVGVCDTSSDLRYLGALIEEFGNQLEYISVTGDALGLLGIGGNGFVNMEANVAPELCADLMTAFDSGDYERAFSRYRTVLALHRIITSSTALPATLVSSIKRLKAVLRNFDLAGGFVRPPLIDLPDEIGAEIGEAIKALSLPELAHIR